MNDFFGFKLFNFFFIFVFLMIICIFGLVFYSIIKNWKYNKSQPRLNVNAKVVSKRTDYSSSLNTTNNSMSSTTWHYVTFEVESGDRIELSVSETDYGQLVEGDEGVLYFQGSQFINFERRK